MSQSPSRLQESSESRRMVDALLDPIASESPAGIDLRCETVYSRIREAKRFDPLAHNRWGQPEAHLPNWKEVADIAVESLRDKSKDLQLAVWLTEAWVHTDGFAGLARGFRLLSALVRLFWDRGLHPSLKDPQEAIEFRTARFEWLNQNLPAVIMQVTVTAAVEDMGPFSFADYEKSRTDSTRAAEAATPPSFYEVLRNDLTVAAARLGKLQDVLQGKLGGATPDLSNIRECLERCRGILGKVIERSTWTYASWTPTLDPADNLETVAPAETPPPETGQPIQESAPPPDAFGATLQLICTGDKGEAVAALSAVSSKSGRDEFRRRAAFAEICVATGHAEAALAILQELANTIDRRQLEQWEHPDFIGRVLLLLHRCYLERSDQARAAEVLARLCRIDPALGITAEAAQRAFRPR